MKDNAWARKTLAAFFSQVFFSERVSRASSLVSFLRPCFFSLAFFCTVAKSYKRLTNFARCCGERRHWSGLQRTSVWELRGNHAAEISKLPSLIALDLYKLDFLPIGKMARPWRRPWRCLPPLCFSVPFWRTFFTVSHTLFWFSLIICQLIRRDRLALNYWDSLFTLSFLFWMSVQLSAPRYSAAEVNGRKVQVKKNFTLETRSWTEWCRGRALGWWWRLAGGLSVLFRSRRQR